MSVKRRQSEGHGQDDREVAGRRANVPDAPYRVVMVASPQSTARRAARDHPQGLLLLNPFRLADAALLDPLQPPTEGRTGIPRWAVYDSAEVPGALLGLLRTPLAEPPTGPGAHSLDPLAVVLATPHAEPSTWHLFGLHVFGPHEQEGVAERRILETAIGVLGGVRYTMTLPRSSSLLARLDGFGSVEQLADPALLHDLEPSVTVMLTPTRGTQPVVGGSCGSRDAPSHAARPVHHDPGSPGALLDRLEPFVVAPAERLSSLEMHPLGVEVPAANRFDLFDQTTARFLSRIVQLDRLTFGTVGMPMPAWLFNDISALPGTITGLGLRARAFPSGVLERLGWAVGGMEGTGHTDESPPVEPDELLPLSMFIAVPVRPPHVWYAHNLASLNALVPELRLTGLGGVTKAVGLSIQRCTEQFGATQWDSKALHVHTRFGPLELLTAWTPAHSKPASLTYRLAVTGKGLSAVLDGRRPPAPHEPTGATSEIEWIGVDDHDAMQALHTRLDQGERLAIVGPPVEGEGGATRVPVAASI